VPAGRSFAPGQAGLGVAEVLISFSSTDRDEILPVLDRYAKIIAAS
jgi:hypothetical protein